MSLLGTAALPVPTPEPTPEPTPDPNLGADGDGAEIALSSPTPVLRPFRYWEYESRYLTTKPEGWELPEVNSFDQGRSVRFGDLAPTGKPTVSMQMLPFRKLLMRRDGIGTTGDSTPLRAFLRSRT